MAEMQLMVDGTEEVEKLAAALVIVEVEAGSDDWHREKP